MNSHPVVEVNHLKKEYRIGLRRTLVEAVRDVSLTVNEGEIVGLIGPNGAGKTTTIKALLGLCSPTSGSVKIYGLAASYAKAREKIGFLSEQPYIYSHLTPREFVDLSARLSGVRSTDRRRRVDSMLERLGVLYAADRSVRKLSKGMLQRVGLAAALVAEPELLILDEPMSGLDPIGRHEVRELIAEERRLGRTVLFSSHVLSDVEALCDRVVVLQKGEVMVSGTVSELLHTSATITELTLRHVDDSVRSDLLSFLLTQPASLVREVDHEIILEIHGDQALNLILQEALARHTKVVSVVPRKDRLEDLFLRRAVHTDKTL